MALTSDRFPDANVRTILRARSAASRPGTRDELKVGTRISAFGAENKDGSFTATGLTVYRGR